MEIGVKMMVERGADMKGVKKIHLTVLLSASKFKGTEQKHSLHKLYL
jgi:hypothetical protein